MKLFQQLLVAPAALGLLAPLAANAAELNINEVSDYASGSEVQNFSDVYPTDWAFQALTSLAERHGCAVSNPSGSITRYEAASLLDKCLGNVAQVSEEERRLINEFAPELALIKGRVDGLESRVSEFEAGQFSKTTTLTGKSAFIIGSVDSDTLGATDDSLTMEYMYQMNMNTSFTGRDKLYARIKSGNVNGYFDNKGDGTYLSAAGQGDACVTVTSAATCTDDYGYLQVDKLWYEFPLGDNFRGWIGPRIENYYMTASSPSIYKPVLKQFALGGNGPVYGSSTSGGFGLAWTQTQDDPSVGRWEASAGYTSKEAANDTLDEGLFGSNAPTALLTKVGYGTSRWQVSLATAFKQNNWEDEYFATNQAMDRADGSSETAIGLRAYWKPDETGALPAVQVGWDTTTVDNNGDLVKDATGWMVGLGWKDVLVDGNKAGVAIGSRMSVKKMGGEGASVDGDPFSWEAYYTFKINDNVSVTPALFGNEDPGTDMNDNTGYVVLTEFRF